MALNAAQKATIRTALFAETDQTIVDARAGVTRRDDIIDAWLNEESAQDAWKESVDRRGLFEAINMTKFNNLTAANRDAWRMMIDNAPIDFSRNKMRAAVVDIWGASDAAGILSNVVRKATRAEAYLGGNSATDATVTALKLNWTGTVSRIEVGEILNG